MKLVIESYMSRLADPSYLQKVERIQELYRKASSFGYDYNCLQAQLRVDSPGKWVYAAQQKIARMESLMRKYVKEAWKLEDELVTEINRDEGMNLTVEDLIRVYKINTFYIHGFFINGTER